MAEADQAPRTIEAGTPMLKVIPPRLVEPYLSGQRSVIAGYLYRARDCAFGGPADFYRALCLGYEGSDFTPDMPEMHVLRWIAMDLSGSLVVPPSQHGSELSTVPEFYTLPVPVPVGAEIHRVTATGQEFIARYDGQAWPRHGKER